MRTSPATSSRSFFRGEPLRLLLVVLVVQLVAFAPHLLRGRILSGAALVRTHAPFEGSAALATAGTPNPMFGDAVFQNEPWSDEVAHRVVGGELPLWNPYQFAGVPLLGDSQSATFYPPQLLHVVFPRGRANLPIAILKLVAAGWFTALLARRLGLGFAPSALAGVAFSLFPWLHLWLPCTPSNVGVLLPAAVLAADVLAAEASLAAAAALALVFGLQHFGGHPETVVHSTVFTTVWFAFRALTLPRDGGRTRAIARASTLFVAAGVAGVLLAAVQVLPFLDYLRESAAWRDRNASAPHAAIGTAIGWRCLSFFLPNVFGNPAHGDYRSGIAYRELILYVGVPTLLFAVSAIAAGRRRRDVAFLGASAVAFLLVALRFPGVHEVVRLVPLLSIAANSRFTMIVGFCLVLLSGFGLDALLSGDEGVRRRIRRTLVAGAFVIAVIAVVGVLANREVLRELSSVDRLAPQAAILGALVVATIGLAFAPLARARWIAALAIALTAADLVAFEWPMHPGLEASQRFPEVESLAFLRAKASPLEPWRIAALDRTLAPNLATAYRLEDVRGDDAMTPWRQDLLLRRTDPVLADPARHRLSEELERVATQFFLTGDEALLQKLPRPLDRTRIRRLRDEWSKSDLPPDQFFRTKTRGLAHEFLLRDVSSPLLDLLGVRFVMAAADDDGASGLREPRFRLVHEDTVRVFENSSAMPRAFLLGAAEVAASPEAALDRLVDPGFDFRKTAVVEVRLDPEPAAAGTATIRAREPERLVVETEAPGPSLLVVTETFDPGVRAECDGKPAPVIVADVAFRGVALPAGRHEVTLRYAPRSLRLGIGLSLATAVILLGIGARHLRIRRLAALTVRKTS
ncbi:MAG: hypothetical protein HYR85_13540 [Planctomycetes bacterium]|nr:hypothetical protein [Planctomycetota bacterium]MBI3846583.1 hypothetical protein [Planctomycetota bacterium]